jgi:hypothetical protein
VIPLYGFLEGDTIGLLVLGHAEDTVASLAARLQTSAGVRVAPREKVIVLYKGAPLPLQLTLSRAGLQPLDRFDVVAAEGTR